MAVLQDSKHLFMYAEQLRSVCGLLQLLIFYCLRCVPSYFEFIPNSPLLYACVTFLLYCHNIMAHGGFFFKHHFLGNPGFC